MSQAALKVVPTEEKAPDQVAPSLAQRIVKMRAELAQMGDQQVTELRRSMEETARLADEVASSDASSIGAKSLARSIHIRLTGELASLTGIMARR